MKWCWIFALGVMAAFKVQAFNFTLSESEFNTWDDRCKKAFAASGAGRSSGFFRNMTPEQNAEVRRFGEEAGGAWHYCAGLILIQRGSAATGKARDENLNRAVNEIRFTYNKIKPDHAWYPEIHIDYARVLYITGQKTDAFNVLKRLVESHSGNSLPYTALAYYLKRENQLQQAIDILHMAPTVLLNESAELNYFLGWYLMEANQLEQAEIYAKKAYELNYPLPTLRQRLAAKGRSW